MNPAGFSRALPRRLPNRSETVDALLDPELVFQGIPRRPEPGRREVPTASTHSAPAEDRLV